MALIQPAPMQAHLRRERIPGDVSGSLARIRLPAADAAPQQRRVRAGCRGLGRRNKPVRRVAEATATITRDIAAHGAAITEGRRGVCGFDGGSAEKLDDQTPEVTPDVDNECYSLM